MQILEYFAQTLNTSQSNREASDATAPIISKINEKVSIYMEKQFELKGLRETERECNEKIVYLHKQQQSINDQVISCHVCSVSIEFSHTRSHFICGNRWNQFLHSE